MSMDCIRSRGFDRLNLSRVFKHSKLNHGLLEICCEYEIPEMVSLITSYICRRHGHHGVPDVMMSLNGVVGELCFFDPPKSK
jgi:hypothetical protein